MTGTIDPSWLAPPALRARGRRGRPPKYTRTCKDCGRTGPGSHQWGRDHARCPDCREARAEARAERRLGVLLLRAAGMSYGQIAKALDMEPNHVVQDLHALGCPPTGRPWRERAA